MQNTIHLSTPSIDINGRPKAKIRRAIEHTLNPTVVVALLDHEKNRKDVMKALTSKFLFIKILNWNFMSISISDVKMYLFKLLDFVNTTSESDLRKVCTTNYAALTGKVPVVSFRRVSLTLIREFLGPSPSAFSGKIQNHRWWRHIWDLGNENYMRRYSVRYCKVFLWY